MYSKTRPGLGDTYTGQNSKYLELYSRQKFLRTASSPPTTSVIPEESSSLPLQPSMTQHYTSIKRYSTVIEEVFVLREENDELRKKIIRLETELEEEKEFNKKAADYIGRLKAERDLTIQKNPNAEQALNEITEPTFNSAEEEIEDLIDHVQETLRSAAEEELLYRNTVLTQNSQTILNEENKLSANNDLRTGKIAEKVNFFQKPNSKFRPPSSSAPVSPLTIPAPAQASPTKEPLPTPVSASKQVVHDIRNQLKRAKSLRNEDLTIENTRRLDITNQFDILAWQRQRQEYISEISVLSKRMADWQASLGVMSTSYRALTTKISALAYSAEKVSFLTEDLNQIRRDHSVLRDKIRESEARYVKQTNHVRICLEALIDSQKEIDDVKDQVAALERERNSLQSDYQNMAIKSSIELASLEESHKRTLQSTEKELAKLRDQVSILESEKSKLVEKLSGHVSELAISQSQALAESATELDTLREEVRVLQQEKSRYSESNEEALAKITSLTTIIAELEENQRKMSLESNNMIESLRLQLSNLQQEKQQMVERLNLLASGQQLKVQEAVSRAEKELESLQQLQQESQVKIITLTNQVASLEEQNKRQQSESLQALNKAKNQISLIEKEKQDVEDEYHARFLAIASQIGEIEKIQQMDKQLTALVTDQQKIITESDEEIQELQKRIAQLERELEQASRQTQESLLLSDRANSIERREKEELLEAKQKIELMEEKISKLELSKTLAEEKSILLTGQIANLESELVLLQQKKAAPSSPVSIPAPLSAANARQSTFSQQATQQAVQQAIHSVNIQAAVREQQLQDQIDALKKEKFETQISLSEYEVRVKSLTSQYQELQESRRKELRGSELKIQSYNQRIDQLTSDKNIAQSRIEELVNEINELKTYQKNKLIENQNEISGLKDEIKILLSERISNESRKHSTLENSDALVASLKSQVNALQEEKHQLMIESNQKLQELHDQLESSSLRMSTNDQVSNEVSILSAQLVAKGNIITGLEDKIQKTENHVTQLRHEIQSLETDKIRIAHEAQQEVDELKHKVVALSEHIAYLESRLSLPRDENESGVDSHSSVEVEALKQRIENLEQEKIAYEQTTKSKAMQLNKMLHTLALEVSQRKEAETKALASLEELKTQYSSLLSDKVAIETEYVESLGKLIAKSNTQDTSPEERSQLILLQQQVQLLQQSNISQQEESSIKISELNTQLDKLHSEYDAKEAKYRSDFASAQEQLEKVRIEYGVLSANYQSDLNSQRDQYSKMCADYDAIVSTCQYEITASRQQIDALFKEKSDLEQEYLMALNKLSKLESEKASMNSVVSDVADNSEELIETKQKLQLLTAEKEEADKEYVDTVSKLVRQLYLDSQFRATVEPELETLRNRVETLSKERDILANSIGSSQAQAIELSSLRQQYNESQSSQVILEQKLQSSLSNIADLENQNTEYKRKLEELSTKIASYADRIQLNNSLQQQIIQAKQELEESKEITKQSVGQVSAMKDTHAKILREVEAFKRQNATLQTEKQTAEKKLETYAQQTSEMAAQIETLTNKVEMNKQLNSFALLQKYKKSLEACSHLSNLVLESRDMYYRSLSDMEDYKQVLNSLHIRNAKVEDVVMSLKEEMLHGEYHVFRNRQSSKSIENFERALVSRRQVRQESLWGGWFGIPQDSLKVEIEKKSKSKTPRGAVSDMKPAVAAIVPASQSSQSPEDSKTVAEPAPFVKSETVVVKQAAQQKPNTGSFSNDYSPNIPKPSSPTITRSAPGLNISDIQKSSALVKSSSERSQSPLSRPPREVTPPQKKKDRDVFGLQTLGALLAPITDESKVDPVVWDVGTEALNGIQSWFANPLIFGQNESSNQSSVNPLVSRKPPPPPPPSVAASPSVNLTNVAKPPEDETDYSISYDSFDQSSDNILANDRAGTPIEPALASTLPDEEDDDEDEFDGASHTSYGEDQQDAQEEINNSLDALLSELASSRQDMSLLSTKINEKLAAAQEMKRSTSDETSQSTDRDSQVTMSSNLTDEEEKGDDILLQTTKPSDELSLSLILPSVSNQSTGSNPSTDVKSDVTDGKQSVPISKVVKDDNIEKFRAEIQQLLSHTDMLIMKGDWGDEALLSTN